MEPMKKHLPTTYISWDKGNKKFSIRGIKGVGVDDEVTVTIKGRVTGVSEREHGGSIDVEMTSVAVRGGDKDLEEMLDK